jgi:hypothetical protein
MSVWIDWTVMDWNGSHKTAKAVLTDGIPIHNFAEKMIQFNTAVHVKED